MATVLTALPNLTALTLDGHLLGDEVLTGLGALPNRFTTLDLTGDAFTPEGVDALVNSPAAATLQRLVMSIGGSSARAATRTLVRGRQLGALRTLHLSGSLLHEREPAPEVGHAFAESAFAGSLEELSMPLGRLGPEGAAALAAAPFRRLRHLALYGNGVGDRGTVALARSPVVATLRSLDLDNNEIGDAGALALAESPYLTGLEHLALRHNRFAERAARALRKRFASALYDS
ncbi:hypothetical protein [Streptomyces sp. NPDC018693]|uniref:hypothetical protein n=1 Tax=unclassified Streptomyces TaxID=2593676 RepID=UPI0037993A0D